MYQPTSWEYVQFLYLDNTTDNTQLSTTGKDFLDAWLATGMAEPQVMATTSWSNQASSNIPPTATFSAACVDLSCTFVASPSTDKNTTIVSYAWDFGDGSTATGQTVQQSYTAAGCYKVTLTTVTDDQNNSVTVVQDVTVSTAKGIAAPGPEPNRTKGGR
jgi:PKD repeat protein